MKVIPPYDSVDIKKGREYKVLDHNHMGNVIIKNDAGEEIDVNTAASAWTFYMPWKVIREKGDR